MSPAAVVDGGHISMNTLKRELDLVRLDPQLKQQLSGPQGEQRRKDLTRQLLAFLIELRVVEGFARASGISVNTSEVEQALQATIQGVGGQSQFQQELKNRGLTLGAVRRNIERQLLFTKVEVALAARAGLPGSAQPAEKGRVFQQWYIRRLRSAHIEVNPRFGRLDPKSGQILAVSSTAT